MKLYRKLQSIIKEYGGIYPTINHVFRSIKEKGGRNFISKILSLWKNDYLGRGLSIDTNEYARWIQNYDSPDTLTLEKWRTEIKSFTEKPTFSIVMPTYNTNPIWLKEAIESVRAQLYPYWELCIADDASHLKETLDVLKHYQKIDPRIKVVFRNENGHISEATNSAIYISTGDWICLLDHDDLLSFDALFHVAKTINTNPGVALIYSDEDKIDDNGQRFDPYFKCDWNYDLFLSQNMISHLGVYRTDIIRKINGFRKGFEGSQDYDLALRFIENIDSSQIFHIPKVLYHWRMHHNSTSSNPDNKPYAVLSAQKAIQDHLQRKNVSATVEILPVQMYRVHYILPKDLPLISIIIPTKDNKVLLKRCIDSIFNKTIYKKFEIIIADNGSSDQETLNYLSRLEKKKNFILIRDHRPFNYSALNNQAVKKASGLLFCFLNDDTEILNSDWLKEMVSIIMQKGVGIVGAKLWYPNQTLQHGGVIMGIGGIASHAHKGISINNRGYFNRAILIQEFSAVTAACMLVRKTVFEELNGFNEKELKVAYNDVDFCLRAREAGYRVVWTPYAELIHYESASRAKDEKLDDHKKRFEREYAFMLQQWNHIIQKDPFYSPNLTIYAEDFSLAWPPRLIL